MSEKLPPITNVTISTVTVDIQTIRVGSKQMTLSIFRQLQLKSIIHESGNLIELPWGWINYDHNKNSRPFIFSHDGTLYRSDIPLEENRHLEIIPEIKGIEETGRFVLEANPNDFLTLTIRLVFDNEQNARRHLENRLASIEILDTAPQLFIAV